MTKTKEEVQTLAIQKAAAPFGLTWQPGFGHMTRGMRQVINEARKRGLIIQSEADLTFEVIGKLKEILIEMAQANAQVALHLGAINQEVQGTEYASAVKQFNNTLLQVADQHFLTLYVGVSNAMHGQVGPFEIEDVPRTWIQRLLMVED